MKITKAIHGDGLADQIFGAATFWQAVSDERGPIMILRMLRMVFAGLVAIALTLAPLTEAHAATARIKDIVNIEGVRDNQLVGYGLVVGLNGSGDGLNNS